MSLSTSKAWNTKLYDEVRRRPGGDIGIEVELEGQLAEGAYADGSNNRYWLAKAEGSLRNGMEYVLAKPVKIDDIQWVLEEFDLIMKRSKPKMTIRCSTHMHVNVLNQTYRQIYNSILFYYLVEEILVRTQGKIRTGNLFCLRMSDAENIADSLEYSLRSGGLTYFQPNSFKYGALNLAAPMKFGSLEFRFLRPITDIKLLAFWADIFYRIVHQGGDIEAKDLLRYFEAESPKKFLARVFDKNQIAYLLDNLEGYDIESLLATNVTNLESIIQQIVNPTPLRLARHLWPSDGASLVLKKKPGGLSFPNGAVVPTDFMIAQGTPLVQAFQQQWFTINPPAPLSPSPPGPEMTPEPPEFLSIIEDEGDYDEPDLTSW